jgi:APA family basic amino acid/polyamine antiporter
MAPSPTASPGSETESAPGLRRYITLRSATLLVVANIIGAGIFTTTGFQAADLGHPLLILGLWAFGGVLAFCGAVCYGELGVLMPRAGGEYVYLRETYGGMIGFMSAFVSLVAGFSAPIAAACRAAVHYMEHFFPLLAVSNSRVAGELLAVAIVWGLIALQRLGASRAMNLSDLFTGVKVAGIVVFIVAIGISAGGQWGYLTEPTTESANLSLSARISALATSLIFVMYCYSGWNASAYLAGEFRRPARDLPRSLMLGTGIVVVLYLLINAAYFYAAGAEQLAGSVEVGQVAARAVLGSAGVGLVTGLIALSLIVSAFAMTIAGPRVYYALGGDYPGFSWLTHSKSGGAPWSASVVQGIVTTIILLTGRVDQIQQYAGFTLTLFAALAVSCVIVLRFRRPDAPRAFRAWGYPWTPIFFLAVSAWMMVWAFKGRPWESMLGIATVALGGILFRWMTFGQRNAGSTH